MRKIVVALTVLLTCSGLLLTFGESIGLEIRAVQWVSIGHIWGGVFFLVVFPLYAWDHISTNRAMLRRFVPLTLSGVVQTASAIVLILTGVVLFLYGGQAWLALRQWHHWVTYPLAGALTLHFLLPKGTVRKTEKESGPSRADPEKSA